MNKLDDIIEKIACSGLLADEDMEALAHELHDVRSFIAGWTFACADTQRLHRTADYVESKFDEWQQLSRPGTTAENRPDGGSVQSRPGHLCPTTDCPYVGKPDFSIGNPCRCPLPTRGE